MVDRLVAVDDADYRLPQPVLAALATEVVDGGTEVGAAVAEITPSPLSKTTSGPAAPLTYVNVADHGATAGNVGNQTPAIQAAIDAAGSGGVVRLPAGTYRCEGTINVPAWTTLEAGSAMFGAGGSSAVELRFAISGSTVAMTLGTYAVLRSIKLRGPGTAVGTCKGITGASATLDQVSVINFATGTHFTDAYYTVLNRCEWSRNGNAVQLTNCYNVNVVEPLMYCGSTVDDSPGVAFVGAGRGLNVVGGSIEGYRVIASMGSAQAISFVGTYFETKVDANAFGIVAAAIDKVSITAIGCMVYLNGHNRWIDTAGSTNTIVNAHGNHFVAVSGSVQAPIAYNISHEQANSIGPDNWGEVVKAGSVYCAVASGSLPARGSIVTMPIGWANGPQVYDGRRTLVGYTLQALNSNGAVTFDSRYRVQLVNLAANATSSIVSNVSNIAQEMEISWVQDATGGHTYAWPTSCRFAGGVAPSDTTASTQTTVRFRYNTSTGHWVEVSRAVAVPN